MNLGENFHPTANARLCSDHFSPECYDTDDFGGKLLKGSIPTIFKECKLKCMYCNVLKSKENKHRSFHRCVSLDIYKNFLSNLLHVLKNIFLFIQISNSQCGTIVEMVGSNRIREFYRL